MSMTYQDVSYDAYLSDEYYREFGPAWAALDEMKDLAAVVGTNRAFKRNRRFQTALEVVRRHLEDTYWEGDADGCDEVPGFTWGADAVIEAAAALKKAIGTVEASASLWQALRTLVDLTQELTEARTKGASTERSVRPPHHLEEIQPRLTHAPPYLRPVVPHEWVRMDRLAA